MHHHGNQVVESLWIGGVPGSVEEAQLQGEDDAVGQLGVSLQLLHVLEAFQVQSQDHWQLLHTHPVSQTPQSDTAATANTLIQLPHVHSPLVRLLLTSTFFTVIFVFTAQRLCVTESSVSRKNNYHPVESGTLFLSELGV